MATTEKNILNNWFRTGAKPVGLKEDDPEAVAIAEIIDHLEYERGDKNTSPTDGEKQRLISMAQTDLEKACMLAVKALSDE